MEYSRQQVVEALRHAGMPKVADEAETTLPDPIDDKTIGQFCTAHSITMSFLTDRMGASP